MKKGITTRFNIFATIALWAISLLYTLMTFDVGNTYQTNSLIDIYIQTFTVKMVLLLAMWIISACILSALFKEVWNRLISDIFNLRLIGLNESYTLCVLITWLLLS
ncbi:MULTISPECIES: hypothetical protein [Pseudoalteromonas]|uniref:Uncharacterized protein n=1 Tax=Pseudoalteromonas agarivorans DSM 14585 TaxID=1312369 RepID=A0ACA8DUD6_9GAMM|nr:MULTISPECIES: hypothetical protein [Pseudoalteromonas]ATC81390.1 hypothetical protein PAGA_a0901 [Pseudoalteromonas agarivorans DSM 14585]|tara:strand:+ start:112 stop:429 length:318 start_codon:yes stop_codon:yes gene_type:complete